MWYIIGSLVGIVLACLLWRNRKKVVKSKEVNAIDGVIRPDGTPYGK